MQSGNEEHLPSNTQHVSKVTLFSFTTTQRGPEQCFHSKYNHSNILMTKAIAKRIANQLRNTHFSLVTGGFQSLAC